MARIRGARLVAAAIALSAVAGCSSSEPRPSSSPGTVPNERVSTDDALPVEFPDDFPLPSDRRIIYSAVSPVGVVVYFDQTPDAATLKQTLLTELKKRGWTLHTCLRSTGGVEATTTIVAGKNRAVATAVIGYSPDFAARLQGRIYTLFVSVATDADTPLATASPC